MWILFGNYNFSQHRFCGWFFSPIFLVWQNVPSVESPVSIICGVQLGAIKHIRVAVPLPPPSISRTGFLVQNGDLVPIKQASQVARC